MPWAYDVWDVLRQGLTDPENHKRAIASRLLCHLALSDPKKRILKDLDALMAVTHDPRFVTARHTVLMELIRIENAERGIRVHVFAPGLAQTQPLDSDGRPNLTTKDVADWLLWALTCPDHLRPLRADRDLGQVRSIGSTARMVVDNRAPQAHAVSALGHHRGGNPNSARNASMSDTQAIWFRNWLSDGLRRRSRITAGPTGSAPPAPPPDDGAYAP